MAPLTPEIAQRLRATDAGPVVVGSIQADGFPRLAHYGSVRVFDQDHLSLWVRDPAADLLQRIAVNPRVTALYRHAGDRVVVHVEGTAARNDDHGVRDAVYATCSVADQERDPGRNGVAVLVEVTRLRTAGTVWERGAAAVS